MRILMIVKSGVTDDARVRREALALAGHGHEVHVIGDRPGPSIDQGPFSVRWVRDRAPLAASVRQSNWARPLRWLLLPEHRRREESAFASAVTALEPGTVDVVHAHDLTGLVPGAEIARRLGARLVYDSHDCWTGRRLVGRPAPAARRRTQATEQLLGDAADAIITVSEPLAAWLGETYGWPHVAVVRNTFPMAQATTPPSAPPSALLYAGRIDEDRDLAAVRRALPHLPVPFAAMGSGERASIRKLRATGASVRPPVPIDDIPGELVKAGLSLVSLSGGQLNHRVALPNKLFQAVQAGVPVVAADLPTIRSVVEGYGIGTLYRPGDAASLVEATRTAIDRYGDLVAHVQAARAELAWEQDSRRLVELYDQIVARSPR